MRVPLQEQAAGAAGSRASLPAAIAGPARVGGPAQHRTALALTSQAPPFSSFLPPMSSEELEETLVPCGRGSDGPVVRSGAGSARLVAGGASPGAVAADSMAGGANSVNVVAAVSAAGGAISLRADAPEWCPAKMTALRREDLEEDVLACLLPPPSPCPYASTWLDNASWHGGSYLGPAFAHEGGGASVAGHPGGAAVRASRRSAEGVAVVAEEARRKQGRAAETHSR